MHGPKTLHHRIQRGGLISAVTESFHPSDVHSYAVFLEDDIEVHLCCVVFCFVLVLSCVRPCIVLFWSLPPLVLSCFGPCMLSCLVLAWSCLASPCVALPYFCVVVPLRVHECLFSPCKCHACRMLLSPRRCCRLCPGSPERGPNHTAK